MTTWLRLCFLLLVALAGYTGIQRLVFDVDPLSLLPQDLPGLHGTRLLREPKKDVLVVTVRHESANTTTRAADALAAHLAGQPNLCAEVRSRPLLDSGPASTAAVVAYAWLNAPPAEVERLAARLQGPALAKLVQESMDALATSPDVREVMLTSHDPLGLARGALEMLLPQGGGGRAMQDEFTSEDGRLRVLFVKPPKGTLGDYRKVHAWLDELRTEVRSRWLPSLPGMEGVTIGFTGDPAFQAEISTGMEADMKQSVGGIMLVVGILFWLLHRSLKPLLWIMFAILCTNLLTLGAAGLIYGSLNVMSMGFAAILTGLIEDFGVMGLHEAREHPGEKFNTVCRRVFPPLAWSAFTTAGIFAMLGLSQLPGVAQLGLLSSLGVLLGAAVMLFGFLPIAMRLKARPVVQRHRPFNSTRDSWPAGVAVILVAAAVTGIVWRGLPGVEFGTQVLRPAKSEAFDELEALEQQMLRSTAAETTVPLVVHGADATAVREALSRAEGVLKRFADGEELKAFTLPGPFVPDAAAQLVNIPRLRALGERSEEWRRSLNDAGFEDSAFTLASAVAEQWCQLSIPGNSSPIWPDASAMELLGGLIWQDARHGVMALGSVVLRHGVTPGESSLLRELTSIPGVSPGGWDYVQASLKPLLRDESRRICLPALGLVALLLPLIFRGFREMTLALATLAFSGFVLCGLMSLSGLSWNLMSLGAVPLVLGLGLDFTIHMMHALRRHRAERSRIVSLGRSLAYCGLSTGLAFGALATGGNRGLITLGLTAMTGVLVVLFTAAFALPWVWSRWPASPPASASDIDP